MLPLPSVACVFEPQPRRAGRAATSTARFCLPPPFGGYTYRDAFPSFARYHRFDLRGEHRIWGWRQHREDDDDVDSDSGVERRERRGAVRTAS